MNNIASEENKVNKVGKWLKSNEIDIALFLIILLGILLVTGLMRLRTLIPLKEPIRIEEDVTTF